MSNVPSNLIPARITELPEAPVANPDGYFPIVIAGTTYKVQFSQIQGNVEVPASRRVNAGTGLTGGGSLSADITIAVANEGITDTQLNTTGVSAGTYGSGASVPVITVSDRGRVTNVSTTPVVVTGYVPTTRTVTAGNGLTGGGTLAANRTFSADYSTTPPLSVGVATVGTSTQLSRGDHVHPAIDLTDPVQTTGALPMGRGGTGNNMAPVAGAVAYSNGSYIDLTDPGTSGYVLQSNGSATPTWVDPATFDVAQADNLNGGDANRIAYQTAPDTTGFLAAPTVSNTYLKWDGSAIIWATASGGGSGTVTSVDGSGGSTGLTLTGGPITATGTLTLGGTLSVASGGTGLGGTPSNGDLLIGDGTGYTKAPLTAGSGISVTNATGSISIANTAQDQVVTLTDGTAISVTGTYPSFTITNTLPDQTVTLTNGTAISVTGTYPSFTLTNTAPDQTVTISSGTNATVTGTYPSFTVSAAGDVVGPAGSTGNAVALFDDGTGKLLKNSPITVSPTGVISGVASPEVNTDAANKLYVDNLVSTGLTFHDPVQLATTSAFTGYSITYNNGSSGVSATITQASSYSSLTIDSTAAALNNRILVKDASNAAYNGVYYVNDTGSGSTPWQMTRTSDADTYGPNVGQLSKNDYFFTQGGVANKGAAFVCTTSGTITFGATGITFTEFSVSQVYTVGNGLSLTGTTISLETPVSVLNGGTGLSSAATNGQLPIGNGAGFTLSTLSTGTGISVTNSTGSISIANTAPDRTVTLTNGTAISVTGTYPSFTLTNTAPDQTVILTGGGGTSISGTYPSFTISSSNSGGGSVSSVDFSGGTTGLTTSGGPITSSGTITLAGTLSISNGGTGLGSTPTNGQLLIGNGTGFTKTTLTAGSNITITNGAGSITISSTGGGGASVSVGTTPPVSPSSGDLWWDSYSGDLKIYYNDGNTSQWVEAAAGATGATGATGAIGTAATLDLGSTTVVNPNVSPSVAASGTSSARTFSFSLPRASSTTIGTVTTGAAGSSATVTNTGTNGDVTLNFSIPKGDTGAAGAAATLDLGATTVVNPNVNPSVAATGTSAARTFSFSLPRASTTTIGTVTTGAAGSSATVTNTGTNGDVTLNFTIPQGATGTAGAAGATGPMGPKSTLLGFPATTDTKIVMFYTTSALTISKIVAVLPGGTSTPSVTFNVRYGSDVSAAGTAVVTGGTTTTNTTTGTSVTSFNNATISAGSFVWVEVTAVSGTVPALSVTLEF